MTAREKVYRVVEVPVTPRERKEAVQRAIQEKLRVAGKPGVNGGYVPAPKVKK
jgi:hypothetical protein